MGRTVTIDKVPQRIISLAPSNTEILYALGLADKVVAVTDYDDYPSEVKDKPSIGGYSNPNIEKIVSLSPDLILADSIQKTEVIPQLEAKGLTVFALDPQNLDGVTQAITLVGEITGADQAAAKLVSQMQSQINEITDKTKNLSVEQKPRVFYIVWYDQSGIMTAGSGTLENELISLAGGVNIAGNLSSYPDISLEAVVAADPEVIIVGSAVGMETSSQFAKTDPILAETSARQNNRIYEVDIGLTGRTGPRLVMGLQQFAEAIHPELFPETK